MAGVDVGALQRQHPEWNIQDAIATPDGKGIWAVGRDGGVFSLDMNGNPSGQTPFFGAYTALAPENRQGSRYFTNIVADPATGGYTLVSNIAGQTYNFRGDGRYNTTATQSVTQAAPPGAPAPDLGAQENQLRTQLRAVGLEGLFDDAWKYYKGAGGGDAGVTLDYLRTTDQYQQLFPGLKEMAQRGEAWNEGQWMHYYNAAQEQASKYGLPSGFLDRDDIGKLLVNRVSADELSQRIDLAGQAVHRADPMIVQKMRDFGLSDGDLTAFFLDPDKATPFVEKKAQYVRAGIGAAAQRTDFGSIDYGTASDLEKMGVTEAQAIQGFGQLAGQHALFSNTAEDTMIGEDITQAEQIGAQFGNNTVNRQEIENRRARRQANFQGGGGAASGGGGRTGLG